MGQGKCMFFYKKGGKKRSRKRMRNCCSIMRLHYLVDSATIILKFDGVKHRVKFVVFYFSSSFNCLLVPDSKSHLEHWDWKQL